MLCKFTSLEHLGKEIIKFRNEHAAVYTQNEMDQVEKELDLYKDYVWFMTEYLNRICCYLGHHYNEKGALDRIDDVLNTVVEKQQEYRSKINGVSPSFGAFDNTIKYDGINFLTED